MSPATETLATLLVLAQRRLDAALAAPEPGLRAPGAAYARWYGEQRAARASRDAYADAYRLTLSTAGVLLDSAQAAVDHAEHRIAEPLAVTL